MNELLVIVGIVFLLCIIIGYIRGFIKIIASLLTTVATIVLVIFINPYVSGVIQKTVPLEAMAQEKCLEILETAGVAEGTDLTREAQISVIEQSKLPEFFKQLLLENNNSEVYTMLGAADFVEYISGFLAKIAADILAFLITFVIATIIVRTILYIFGIIGDLPVIGGINRAAGGLLGLGTGFVIVWILFIAATLMYDTAWGGWCMEKIADNQILTVLYEGNILMEYITKLR